MGNANIEHLLQITAPTAPRGPSTGPRSAAPLSPFDEHFTLASVAARYETSTSPDNRDPRGPDASHSAGTKSSENTLRESSRYESNNRADGDDREDDRPAEPAAAASSTDQTADEIAGDESTPAESAAANDDERSDEEIANEAADGVEQAAANVGISALERLQHVDDAEAPAAAAAALLENGAAGDAEHSESAPRGERTSQQAAVRSELELPTEERGSASEQPDGSKQETETSSRRATGSPRGAEAAPLTIARRGQGDQTREQGERRAAAAVEPSAQANLKLPAAETAEVTDESTSDRAADESTGADEARRQGSGRSTRPNQASSNLSTAASAAAIASAEKAQDGGAVPSEAEGAAQQVNRPGAKGDALTSLLDRGHAGTSGARRAAAAGDDEMPRVDPARFIGRVAKAFHTAHERGGTLQLRLSPPELGSLRLELSVSEGVMTASLETETASARRLLLDHLPALRDRLAEQNIRVERFDVDVRRDGGGQADGRAAQHQPNDRPTDQPPPRRQPTADPRDPEPAPRDPQAINARPNQGQINLVA